MEAYLAGDDGIEPPNVGIKIRCLTAWRIPYTLFYNTLNACHTVNGDGRCSSMYYRIAYYYAMIGLYPTQ